MHIQTCINEARVYIGWLYKFEYVPEKGVNLHYIIIPQIKPNHQLSYLIVYKTHG
jgi:hypothetical protein